MHFALAGFEFHCDIPQFLLRELDVHRAFGFAHRKRPYPRKYRGERALEQVNPVWIVVQVVREVEIALEGREISSESGATVEKPYLRPQVEGAVGHGRSSHDQALLEACREAKKSLRQCRIRVLDLVRFIQQRADVSGLQKQRQPLLFGFEDLVMGEVNTGRTVERTEIGALVLAQEAGFQMGVDRKFVAPVLEQAPLGDDDDGIDGVLKKPVQNEIYADLGLAKPLLMKNSRIGKVLHRLECFNLIDEALMLRRKVRFAVNSQHGVQNPKSSRVTVFTHAASQAVRIVETTVSARRLSCQGTARMKIPAFWRPRNVRNAVICLFECSVSRSSLVLASPMITVVSGASKAYTSGTKPSIRLGFSACSGPERSLTIPSPSTWACSRPM